MLVVLVVLSAVCLSGVCASALSEDEFRASFINYTRSFGKQYTLTQMFAKYDQYKATLADINAHNANPASTYRKTVNQYSDLTAAEFAAMKGLSGADVLDSGVTEEYRQYARCHSIDHNRNDGIGIWSYSGLASPHAEPRHRRQEPRKLRRVLVILSDWCD